VTKRMTSKERSQLRVKFARRYQKGESIRGLATASGMAYGTARNLLLESGVVLRGRGGANRKSHK